ncbi:MULTISPECIES: DUF4333 domain-containing protein [unclassified Mycobacterium]|uniref:DUF4333 domain-containing protein n=1 Tax=unclassified Mycobacterium TaxID=2642494 RepID=UPI0029C90A74|nr:MULTISPECIES: DUF4333 domain-containing protein [unclassified Mycobacterium]
MSGPQGPDPTQPWPGSQPPSDPAAWQQSPAPDQPTEAPAWGQGPAYPQQQYPGYQQPGQPGYAAPAPGYPAADQYGQQPTAYGPGAYAPSNQPTQYGQPDYGQQPTQYGQPGQYGQPPQYGQPADPNAYGQQFSPYPGNGAGSANSSKKTLLIAIGAIVALLVIALGVTGFWKPGFLVTTELDVNAAQTGVAQILSDDANGYGAKNVSDVKCNDGNNPKVEKGANFTCDVSIDGTKRQVTVTFQDSNGTYEVGRPK